jgi:uncharacterized membrane protein YkoI
VRNTITKVVGSSAAVAVLALGSVAAPAVAQSKHHHQHHAKRHSTNSSSSSSSSSSKSQETLLTGDTLTKASDAALAAVPGGTVTRASTENDNSDSNAAYEVHVTKSDGTHVVVIEDASFTVLSTTAESGHGNCHGGDSSSTSSSTSTTT